MLNNKLGFVPYFVVFVFLHSCIPLGINPKIRTARHSTKFPAFTIQDTLKGSLTEERRCFDVNYYDINLKIDPSTKTISGEAGIYFKMKADANQIQLDLDPRFKVESVRNESGPLSFTRKYTALYISAKEGFKQNQNCVITVKYEGSPKAAQRPPWKGGFVWKKDKVGNPWCSVACQGEGPWLWLPIKSYLGDEPDSVRTIFTVPSGLQCVSNGKFIGENKIDDKWTSYSWKVSYPINPYNITFYLGNFIRFVIPYYTLDKQNMDLEFFVLPNNLGKAVDHFKQTEKIIRVYEELYGPYPWPKDGFKLVEAPFEGMEHQTAIAYGSGYKNDYKQEFDYIILHETAHEWWGNSVSVSDFSDIWLHEGMASFAEALYVEKTKGKAAYYDYIWNQATSTMNRSPIILPKAVHYWNYKDGDVYMKGSAVLNTFRNVIRNDSVFLQLLKDFHMQNRNRNVSSEDFFSLLKSKTDKNLDPLIAQYFYKRESPLLRWNYDTDENGKSVFIAFFQRVPDNFILPVTIEQDGKKLIFNVSSKKTYFELPSDSYIVVNPDWSFFQDDRIKHLR